MVTNNILGNLRIIKYFDENLNKKKHFKSNVIKQSPIAHKLTNKSQPILFCISTFAFVLLSSKNQFFEASLLFLLLFFYVIFVLSYHTIQSSSNV